MTDPHTDSSRGQVTDHEADDDIEKTRVGGVPRVTSETSQASGASSSSEGSSPDEASGSSTRTEGTSGQDATKVGAFTAAAKSKLTAAKEAATRNDRERRSSTAERPTATPSSAPSRGPRRARLRLTRIDPWSVMKTAFLLSIAFAVVTVVAVGMVWQVLGAAGVWDSINDTVQSGIGGDEVSSFQVQDYVGTSRVLGFTMLVAAVDVVLITAAATLSAFLYNMAAALLGGIEVTLSEDVD